MTMVSTDLRPLVVDVDAALLRTDLVQEAALQYVARHFLSAWRLIPWMLRGREALTRSLLPVADPGVPLVPLCEDVMGHVRIAQDLGRPVYLVASTDQLWVRQLADRIGGVAGVYAPGEGSGTPSRKHVQQLLADLDGRGFDCIGGSSTDDSIWKASLTKLFVGKEGAEERAFQRRYSESTVLSRRRLAPKEYLRSLRVHQWSKNVLVFLTVLTGHSFSKAEVVGPVMAGFAAFCLAASSAYIINDLMDLPGDREHPRKSKRPFASGMVPVSHGIAIAVLLMVAAVSIAASLAPQFLITLGVYVVLTLAYSFFLKRRLLVDVIVLAGLYTIRVFGGVAAANQTPSYWLLLFSLFLFLSLATIKRCSELVASNAAGKPLAAGRGYRNEDLEVLLPLGAAAGYGAVLVIALYLYSPEVAALYEHPMRLGLLCPLLLYWISRALVLANRNQLPHDPVVFALTDRISWLTALTAGIIIAAAV